MGNGNLRGPSTNVGSKSCRSDPQSCRGTSGVAVLDEWGPPGEHKELIDTPKSVVEILAAIAVGKKKLDNKAVATAVGWLLLFMLRKATGAELTAEAKVALSADSCFSESEACECE